MILMHLNHQDDQNCKNPKSVHVVELNTTQNASKSSLITKVTQNNTGIYTKGISQQTFEIPNNNLDVKFERLTQTTTIKYDRPEKKKKW